MTDITFRQNTATREQLIAYFEAMYANGEIRAVADFPPYVDKLMSNATIFEAWVSGALSGFLALYCNRPEKDFTFIPQINVEKHLRGGGAAQKLMHEAIQFSKGLGFAVVRLCVNKSNERALAFYDKIGFKKVSETDRQFQLEFSL